MSTLKIEHISHLDNGTPDLSIDSSGHLNIVNGNLQMGGVTMLNTSTGAPLPLSGGAITGELIIADTGALDIRMGTDKRVTWSGALGEIGSVAGFQATNTAGSALSSFGMRGTDLRFATGSAERLRITDSAVGIGTDSPSTTASGYNGGTLHVHNTGTGSSIRLTNNTTGTSTTSGMLISKWSDSKTYFTNFDDGADTIFTQSNSSGGLVTTLALDGDGNVGIGTTGPEVKLEVNGGADDSVVFGGRSDGGNGNNRRFNLIAYADGGGANYGGGLKIQTRDSVNVFHDRITVQSNGHVGIGADTPENSLHIKNNTATNGQMIIQGDANNTYIRMNKSGSTWAIGIDASDSNSFKIGNNTNLSSGTRLTVTTSGKVLINTTDPQDDPSMLRVLNSMSNLGGMCIGKVHNSTNNNNAAVLLHRLGQGQGHQFSGKFVVNSWTGNRHIDCHITSYYTNDALSVNTNFTNSGGIAATTVRLCTVNVGGVLYLAFVKDGGGSGVSYVNAFIEGNIHFEGGVRELLTAGQGFTVTATHHTF